MEKRRLLTSNTVGTEGLFVRVRTLASTVELIVLSFFCSTLLPSNILAEGFSLMFVLLVFVVGNDCTGVLCYRARGAH